MNIKNWWNTVDKWSVFGITMIYTIVIALMILNYMIHGELPRLPFGAW